MQRIFVLGDSRTGTTSLHKFFLDLGFNSIHFYLEEANIRRPADKHYSENWRRLESFYTSCDYNAFSDYPTRIFYRDIYKLFPDAYFILSERESAAVWRRSAEQYFVKRGVDVDLDKRVGIYEELNRRIAEFFERRPEARFLRLVIDQDADVNARRIKDFLGIESAARLLRLNTSSEGAQD